MTEAHLMRETGVRMPVGIVKYATILSFWTMLIVWEIEAMRVLSKLDQLKQISFKLAIQLVEYDSTMLLLSGFTFVSAIFYMVMYQKKVFGITVMLLSFFFIAIALINGEGISNFYHILK